MKMGRMIQRKVEEEPARASEASGAMEEGFVRLVPKP